MESTLYVPDIDRAMVVAMDLQAPIVDYVCTDLLYIATYDHLYEIDPLTWRIIDKTPLPLRFNYLVVGKSEIILISSNEIIILDRKNLSLKSGIGVDLGDHRPIIKDKYTVDHTGEKCLYLVTDEGARSIVRIIDIQSGKLIKKATIERVKHIIYDSDARTLVALDIKNSLSIFDLKLKRKKRINLAFDAQTFTLCPEGFSVDSDRGIFLVGRNGRVIDFQPMQAQINRGGSVVLMKDAIVQLDTTVLRINAWLGNNHGICRLLSGEGSTYEIGIDRQENLYLLRTDPLAVVPLEKQHRQLAQAVASAARVDSLWYLQLGAFSDPANAFRMYHEMRAKGVPAIVDTSSLYRIKFGGFPEKLFALDLIDKMQLKGWLVYEPKLLVSKRELFHVNSERYSVVDGVIRKE